MRALLQVEPQPAVQLAAALPASLGFALMFNLRPRLLAVTAAGGLATWAFYLLIGSAIGSVFAPCFVASVFAAAYARVLAHVFRAPISIFYIICEIPLIPGRGLYYTVSSAVQGDWVAVQSFGLMTAEFALAIAFGIGLAWALGEIARQVRATRRGGVGA